MASSRTPPGSDSSMANPQKLSRVVTAAIDRFSDLPDSLICYILSFLPTKRAVATSVLSTRWRSLWTKVPVLDFDNFDRNNEKDGTRMNFVQFVNKVLLNHDAGNLNKFQLKWWRGCEVVYVNIWVNYAIARNVRVLVLDLHLKNLVVIHLPAALFTLGTLEVLRLQQLMEVKVPRVVCLPKLEVLNLIYLEYESEECFHRLISGCPVLHSLEMDRCEEDNVRDFMIASPSLRHLSIHNDFSDYDGKLEINAPNLEYLALEYYTFKECSVTIPSLNTVKLNLQLDDLGPDYTDGCDSTVKLMEAVNSVKFLTLRGGIMESLTNATIPFSACFKRLTKLDVDCRCCQWSCLVVMLGYLIRLQDLNIRMLRCCKGTHKDCWKDPKQVPECLLWSLSHISLSGFTGVVDQIAMVRYILKQGVVLKSTNVKSARGLDWENKFGMLKKIATFPRCSSTCEVNFD